MRIKIIIILIALIVFLVYGGNQVYILGLLALPGIMYYIIRSAVHEGVYNALIEYDRYKKEDKDNRT